VCLSLCTSECRYKCECVCVCVCVYLRWEGQRGRDPGDVGSRHATTDLLTELSDVTTGSVQVPEQDGEIRPFLSRLQEGPQATHLHAHAVQGTLGKLEATGQRSDSDSEHLGTMR